MTSSGPGDEQRPGDSPHASDDRIRRLERRVERERTARAEAERIAEDGMRSLWSANRELEQRVAERTAELEASLVSATVSARAKERFLADLGHDLATPLHNVLGLLELVDTECLSPTDRERIEGASAQAARLADLLRGLVDLAGADSKPTSDELTTRHPGRWLDDAVESWTLSAARRAQLLVPSASGQRGEVRANWGRLRRSFDAALSNVVTHAGPGAVDVDLHVGDDVITLEIVDAGPGITPSLLDTVTEPFVASGPSAGAGIGLALADRLLRSAGGSLSATVDDGRTTVRLELTRS